jgi:hypothetical protein
VSDTEVQGHDQAVHAERPLDVLVSGLSGGAALDADRNFAGIALLKPPVVAGGQGSPPAQAVLVPASAVREFLKANDVTPPSDAKAADVKAAVVRIVCVRK